MIPMAMRRNKQVVGGILLTVGLVLLAIPSAAAEKQAAGKAQVKGWVTQGKARHEITSVAVLREGPVLVLLFTDKAIPAGKAQAFADKLLEGTGLMGIKMGLAAPGSELSAKGSSPLFVQFLPGDGSLKYDSGPSPKYEFKPETMTSKGVAGQLQGTIILAPEQVDVDIKFNTPIE